MVTEEMLVTQLIEEGQKFLDEHKWRDAVDLFSEAENLDKWKDLYGGQIYASLAYAFAQLGDKTKAKHFIALFDEQFGEYGVAEDDELEKVKKAS